LFLDFLRQFDAADRYGRRLESLESEHRPDSLLYPAMILLDHVVQILAGSHPYDLLVKVPSLEQILCRGRFRHPGSYRRIPGLSTVCTRTPELALAAVDKALIADPTDLPAQCLRLKILDATTR